MARRKTDSPGRQAMAARIRAKTGDGTEVEDYMISLMRGDIVAEYKIGPDGNLYPAKMASPFDRAYAANWLDERMNGKLPDDIDPIGELTAEQEDRLFQVLLEKRSKRLEPNN